MGGNPDFDNIDSFDATYVGPYTKKLKTALPELATHLRQQLLGHPGALARELGLRPKNAF
jgi:hypothetical protein